MDFPVCPACGQSVIDDDVEDCPFCGSSMKAKPGSKPAAKPAAKSAVAAKTPAVGGKTPVPASKSSVATKPAAGKPAAGKGPADDFPFETEVPGAKTAIQAMPNSSKGRTLEVTCPMCETKGFLPPTAAGKDVKCANPKCMVPIFKAPLPTIEAPPTPPPKKSNMMLVGGATVALMAIAGGAAVYISSLPTTTPPGKKELSEEDKKLLTQGNTPGPVVDPVKPVVDPANDKPAKVEDVAAATPETLIADALKQLNDACLKRDSRQRSKPYCRQMAADACIRAGDMKAANEHLAQLIVVGSAVPYFRVEPNLELFWKAWSTGDKAAATKLLDTSMEDVRKLPEVGRGQMELASRLAAALAVAGRIKEGLTLLEEHQSAELEGQLAARVQMASDARVSRLTNSAAVLPWVRPQAVATTSSLAARGQLDAARQWAEAQPADDSRFESLAIWAQEVAERQAKPGPADSNAEIVDALKGKKPAPAARVWARAAFGRFVAGDKTGAEATLKLAQDLLASIPVPTEPVMPTIKATVTYKVPEATSLVQGATAAAEVAYVHLLWPDHRPQAEAALEQALHFARGLAPAWPAVNERLTQSDNAGQAGLRELMKKELALKSDDQASQSAVRYRTVLAEIKGASQRRFNLQATILSRLAEAGLKDKVWAIASERAGDTNPSRRDDFLATNLIGELLEQFHGTETEKVILGAVGGTPPQGPATMKQLLYPNGAQESAAYVNRLDANSGYRDDTALTVATKLASLDRFSDALLFVSKLDDIVLREEAYRLIAPLITQRGHRDEVWKQAQAVQQATEKASLCRGLVVGLKAGPPKQDVP